MALDTAGLPMDVITSVVVAAGFDLEDVVVRAAGERRAVRIVIDSDDGVDLDAAADLSRAISAALDEQGDEILGGQAYTLEVTSPGVGSPLTAPRHFRRAARRRLTLTRRDGTVQSVRMARMHDDGILVLTEGKDPGPLIIPLAEIARATVDIEFAPPPARVIALLEQLIDGAGRPDEELDEEPRGEGKGAR